MMYVSYIVHISNYGDAYVFFDTLDSCKSVLASDSQTLALHNGCQEVVSKGGLDRFARPTLSSITLTVSTLEAKIKNQQLSRGSKYGPIRMFKNEGPLKPIPTLDKLPNSCAIVRRRWKELDIQHTDNVIELPDKRRM